MYHCDYCGQVAVVLARNVFLCRAHLVEFSRKASSSKRCVRCERPLPHQYACRDISIDKEELFSKLKFMGT